MELHQCPECGGTGEVPSGQLQAASFTQGCFADRTCPNCDGCGWIGDDGEPYYLEPEMPECLSSNSTTKSRANSRS